MTHLLALAVALVTGVVVAVSVRPVLVRLPEPVGVSESDDKIAYLDLGSRRFVLTCALVAVLAQAIALVALPLSVQPLWTVLAVCGVLLAAIDARTTWLPLRLTRLGWVLMALAAAASPLLGASLTDVLRTVGGAALAGSFYFLVWLVTKGGFGFGDVRFAPLLGAATASQSWTLLVWGLMLGNIVGAVHAGGRLVARLEGGFPYAPSMLAGCYLAVLALRLLAPSGPG